MLEDFVAYFHLFFEVFCFRDVSTFPFLLGRSASRWDSVSARLDSPVLERRRGRLHPCEMHAFFYWFAVGYFDGLQS